MEANVITAPPTTDEQQVLQAHRDLLLCQLHWLISVAYAVCQHQATIVTLRRAVRQVKGQTCGLGPHTGQVSDHRRSAAGGGVSIH